jgi:hydrogenase/urease accessory protein HupE
MRRIGCLGFVVLSLALSPSVDAHPAPFTFLDVRIEPDSLELTLVAHVFDVAHELGIEPPGRLLDPDVLDARRTTIAAMLAGRLQVVADGLPLEHGEWSPPAPIRDRQSIELRCRYRRDRVTGSVAVTARLFPYDPQHQTFLNFYEGDRLGSQAILDGNHVRYEYFAGTGEGALAVVRKFVPAGIHHILTGPDHLLFLVGLLLLGGSIRRLLLVVTAFTLAHSVTLSLAALDLVTPPARLIEPAIALSIVYVGIDNLMVGHGRDVRALIAFSFGFIHGFGFANVLREMELPSRALGWSLFSFNLGVEIGQLSVVILVASVLAALRSRSEVFGRRLAFAGSLVVIAMGAFWFVQRVFFGGVA